MLGIAQWAPLVGTAQWAGHIKECVVGAGGGMGWPETCNGLNIEYHFFVSIHFFCPSVIHDHLPQPLIALNPFLSESLESFLRPKINFGQYLFVFGNLFSPNKFCFQGHIYLLFSTTRYKQTWIKALPPTVV